MTIVPKPTVLVVDDEAPVRHMFVRALQRRGFEVLEADTGTVALELIASHEVDVVLLDNALPDLAGTTVLERLRSSPETATLPVLLVTGHADVDHRISGLEAGADDFIAKPVELDELVARVQSRLRGRDAWMVRVESSLHERARLAGALAAIAPNGSPSSTATEIARVLVRLPSVTGASVVALGRDGSARFLARVDAGGEATVDGAQAIDPPTVVELSHEVDTGAGVLGPDIGRRLVSGAPESAVVAALAGESGPVAAIVLGTPFASGDANDLRRLVSAAMDLAPVVERVLVPSIESLDGSGVVDQLRDVIDQQAFWPVYQPIVDLESRQVRGFEALTRFEDGTRPDRRFDEATRVGLGFELELATLGAALVGAAGLPAGCYLSVNVSAALLTGRDLAPVLAAAGDRPVVLELTEHERVDDYASVRAAVDQLGPEVRLSVDDAGSGWASLRHVLALRPHFVKLDRGWISAIETDPARQALLLGIAGFAETFGGAVVAEGIETVDELDTLRRLGIGLGQGYHLGRPERVEHYASIGAAPTGRVDG